MFTLSEAYEAINGHDEFAVKVYDGLISFDYIVVFPGSFDASEEEVRDRAYYLWEKAGGPIFDSVQFWLQAEIDCKRFAHIRRNMRGVTFDAAGNLVSLPLHKFFNVNQTAETQFDLIKHHTATIYEKLDGCLDGNTPIEFCDGTFHKISEIVKNKLVGPVWGFENDRVVETEIIGWFNNGLSPNWVTIEVEDRHNGKKKRSIACTSNHKCLTSYSKFSQNEYIQADALSISDNLFVLRDRFNSVQKSMILGSLLGDMSLDLTLKEN